jgi:hypothetical protein
MADEQQRKKKGRAITMHGLEQQYGVTIDRRYHRNILFACETLEDFMYDNYDFKIQDVGLEMRWGEFVAALAYIRHCARVKMEETENARNDD